MSTVATTPKPGQQRVADSNAPKVYKLTALDRCDRCGPSSQAYVRVTMKETGHDLLFCGHHYNKFKFDLVDLIDHDKTINEYDRLDTGNRLIGSENS